jgi:hypothetical protein
MITHEGPIRLHQLHPVITHEGPIRLHPVHSVITHEESIRLHPVHPAIAHEDSIRLKPVHPAIDHEKSIRLHPVYSTGRLLLHHKPDRYDRLCNRTNNTGSYSPYRLIVGTNVHFNFRFGWWFNFCEYPQVLVLVGPGVGSHWRQTNFCGKILVSNPSLNIVGPGFNSQ